MAEDGGRELLVLGMLRRSPMSAYDVDRAVREHVVLYRPLKHGGVYHLLRRLAERGILLRKEVKAQRGPAETKSFFRLSAAGERHFHTILKRTILDIQTPDPALEIAYVLLGQLSRRAALEILEERAREVAAQERRLLRLYGKLEGRTGAGYIAVSHTVNRLRDERGFLLKSIELMGNPTWSPQWVAALRPGKERSVEEDVPENQRRNAPKKHPVPSP